MERLKVSDVDAFKGNEGRVVQVGNSDSAPLYRLIRVMPESYEVEVEKIEGQKTRGWKG